jgi:hypothetical protein
MTVEGTLAQSVPLLPDPAARVLSTPLRPASTPANPRALTFDAAVPRYLVHRASIAEVFVTDSAEIGDNAYQVAALLPRGHYVGENAGLYDYLILVEVVRQAGVLVAHTRLDVPLQTAFIFRELCLQINDLRPLYVGASPGEVVITMTVSPQRTGAGRLRGLSFEGGVAVDGRLALHGSGKLLFVSRDSFKGLRRRGRENKLARQRPAALRFTPARPEAVGRRDVRNVVVTEAVALGGQRYAMSLVIDVNHPYMFDHPLDHVPGNLSLEAARQAAIASVARQYGLAAESLTVLGAEVEFGEFAEIDLITRVTAEVGDLGSHQETGMVITPVSVTLTQADVAVATAKVQVAVWA